MRLNDLLRSFVIFNVIVFVVSTYAQSPTGIGTGWWQNTNEENKNNENKKESGPKVPAGMKVETKKIVKIEDLSNTTGWIDETRYFKDIRMDSLWFVGVGKPISEKKALLMDTVYRMSMKLNNGKHIHVECLNHGKPLVSERLMSKLLPVEKYDYDIDGDSSWIDSEKMITQIFQYPSVDNIHKSFEIGCDGDGTVVHSASIEYITDNSLNYRDCGVSDSNSIDVNYSGRAVYKTKNFVSKNNLAIIVYYDSNGNIVNLTNPLKYLDGTIVIADFKKNPVFTVSDIGGWPIKKFQ